jgi:hypothetical protein
MAFPSHPGRSPLCSTSGHGTWPHVTVGVPPKPSASASDCEWHWGSRWPRANRVRASTVLRLPSLGLGGGVALVLMVLAEADMLDDDRVPAIVSWFERETADLPPSIAKELGVWFDVQRNGSARTPRCRPRTESTTRLHTRWMLPAVRAWSADGHHSLREISKEDVLLALPPGGNERVLAAKALRTLFSVLKARGLVFVNPTAANRAPRAAPAASPRCPGPSSKSRFG